jgi:hypothetical protein
MVCQAPGCGQVFEAKRKTAKYHSRACSMRASRAGAISTPPTPASPEQVKAKPPPSHCYRSTRAELAEAGRVGSSHGQAALILAWRIDHAQSETGAAVSAMINSLAGAMERALRGDKRKDPVARQQDEVARRREQHARSGRAG